MHIFDLIRLHSLAMSLWISVKYVLSESLYMIPEFIVKLIYHCVYFKKKRQFLMYSTIFPFLQGILSSVEIRVTDPIDS